jgi:hypothetical protein
VQAALTATLDDAALSATVGNPPAEASLNSSLDGVTLASTATPIATAALESLLEETQLTAAASPVVTAALAQTVEGAQLTAVAGGFTQATAPIALDDATLTATASTTVVASLTATLAGLSVLAEAEPVYSGGFVDLSPVLVQLAAMAERLERIENQLIADVSKGASRYKRFLPGTETIILDKDVAYNPVTGFTLTEHQELPP